MDFIIPSIFLIRRVKDDYENCTFLTNQVKTPFFPLNIFWLISAHETFGEPGADLCDVTYLFKKNLARMVLIYQIGLEMITL